MTRLIIFAPSERLAIFQIQDLQGRGFDCSFPELQEDGRWRFAASRLKDVKNNTEAEDYDRDRDHQQED